MRGLFYGNKGVTFRGVGSWGPPGNALALRECAVPLTVLLRGEPPSRAACALDARPLMAPDLHIACGGAPMILAT